MNNAALKNMALKCYLTYDKGRDAVYGQMGGYGIILTEDKKDVQIHFSVKEPDVNISRGQVVSALASLQSGNPAIKSQGLQGYQVTVVVKPRNAEMLIEICNQVVSILQSSNMINACQACGSDQDVSLGSIHGVVGSFCGSCLNRGSEIIVKKEAPKGNILLGIFGALVGSFVGVICYVLLYQMGWILGVTGMIMFYCSYKAYQTLGRRDDMAGIIICCVICVVMIFVGMSYSLLATMRDTLADEGYVVTLKECIPLLQEALSGNDRFEVIIAIAQDLLLSYVFMIVAASSTISQHVKQVKFGNETVRL